MADQELTDLVLLTTLANADLFFVRDVSTGIDKQIAASDMTTLFGGGNFLSHSDTPVNYTGAQNNFVKVNGAGTALEFIADPGYLTDITAELLEDLSDVTITSVGAGELLTYTGSEWENQTLTEAGVAAASHTHVEADITDLQNYSLVGHTHVEADITDLQAYLLNINAESIDDLSDVDTTSSAPSVGEHLEWDGSNWVPGAAGGGTFLSLGDTPASYAAAGTFFVRVNAGATALEFVADPGYSVAGHTHVEADITDLQNYALVGHTHVEADITDLQAYVLPTDSIDILADVDTTTVPPSSGDCLAWNGSNWIPASSMAPGAHASTHISLGSDEIDGDKLDIDFAPSNYTRSTAPAEVTTVVELTAHLAGIDTKLGGTFPPSTHTHVEADITDLQNYALVGHTHVEADITDLQAYLLNINAESIDELSDVDTTTSTPVSGDVLQWNGSNWVPVAADTPGNHASTHLSGATDEVDGDRLDIDFVPTNYTRSTAPAEVTLVVELTAHLKGIDDELATFAPVSHTHVEADITDLQNYALVGHTHVEADIIDLQAYALASLTLTAGEGLQGGGDLSANRTFDLDINSLAADGAPDGAVDFVVTYDDSAGSHKKVLLNNLPGGGGGGAGTAAQSVVQARRTTTFSDAADTWQTITFDATDIENNSLEIEHDNTLTSRINLVKAGPVLIFYASVVSATASSTTEARVLLNGTTEISGSFQKISPQANGSFGDLDNVFAFIATAGDYIELQFQDTGTTGNQDVNLETNVIFGAVRLTGVSNELFTDLSDTPGDYIGAGSQFVKVNSGATALEFVADPGFITDITGEAFLDLSDTPSVYTGAGSQFVKVNSGGTAVEFVADPGFLTNINSEDLTDLSDVTITAVGTGELLTFTGTVWENQTLAEAGIATASHTHVEADITDLQAYLLNITGESFLDLADTPSSYAGGGSRFVKVNSGATDLEFVADPGFLLDITGENIGDLNDVTITTVIDGEILRFNGSIWINNTLAEAGVAPVSHTHVEADITDLQNYALVGHTHVEADIIDLQNYALVGHTHVEADITDLQAYLLNITNENLDDLSDVVLTTEVDGELLRFNGTNWVNNTLAEAGVAPASHTHVEADITDLQNYSLVGHTHVEADITDLQAYLLNITGEDFTDLSDTPANYSGAGSRFVKVNSGATALEFVADPGFLTDITGENIGDLNDVTITTVVDGEILRFNGSIWINNTLAEAGVAPVSHTHVEADITDLGNYSVVGHTHVEADITDLTKDIIVQEEGSTVTGGPHDTLNFVGAGVTVTDGTGGVATITIPVTTAALDDLTDVTISTPSTGQFIRKSAGDWLNVNIVEADISDLQSYLLDITGEPIGDLSDVTITTIGANEILKWNGSAFINNTLAEAGIATASHTHVEADITDLTKTIIVEDEGSGVAGGPHDTLNFVGAGVTATDGTGGVATITIPGGGASALDDLTDVTISTPSTGQFLRKSAGDWLNATLVEADISDLQAYLLNITNEDIGDLSDVSITTVSTGELLAFTGAGWENQTLAELSIATSTHAATHIAGGADEVDGDRLDIDFSPVNYTPDTTPAQVTLTNELTAHLAGIDNEMLTVGSLPKWDRQMASATSSIETTSTTFVDVPDLTLTTDDLGGGQDGSYLIHFSASVSHASQKTSVEFRLLVDGVEVTTSVTTVNFADTSLFLDSQFSWYEDPIINNKIIKVQWRQTKTSGNPAGRTAVMTDRRLIVSGVPSNAVV